jgi:hypothetical protein
MTDPQNYEGWVPAFTAPTDYEADLVRDRLGDAGIPAVVLTQRDHVFNLNVGELAVVQVLVPPDRLEEARALTSTPAISDAELEAAAMEASPVSPDAYTPEAEAALDSGMEQISFDVPDDTTFREATPSEASDQTPGQTPDPGRTLTPRAPLPPDPFAADEPGTTMHRPDTPPSGPGDADPDATRTL